MSFSNSSGENLIGCSVFTSLIELEESIYILKNPDNNSIVGAGAEYNIGGGLINSYNTTQVHKGELKITKFNPTNSIISGTFWFDAVNEEGEIVEIREGRFDMQYTN